MLYQRNSGSLHSWVPTSVLFTVDGVMESHAPVFFPRRRRPSVGERPPTAAERDSTTSCPIQCRIFDMSLARSCAWSLDRNLTQPHRATINCPMTIHGAVKFSCDIWVGSGISTPTYLTRIPMIVQPGMCTSAQIRGSGGTPIGAPSPMAESCPLGPGGCTAKIPTPVGGNSAGPYMQPEGDCSQTLPSS